MSEFVRIRLESGWEASVTKEYADTIEGVDIIDAPATDSRGFALEATRKDGRPAKATTTVRKAAAKKAADSTPSAGAAGESPEEASA